MNPTEIKTLEKIASEYHLNTNVPDKFIEDLIQDYCCDWLKQFINLKHSSEATSKSFSYLF